MADAGDDENSDDADASNVDDSAPSDDPETQSDDERAEDADPEVRNVDADPELPTDDGEAPETGEDALPAEVTGSDEPDQECPECGDPIPAGAQFCPHCETVLADGEAVDLSELDGLLEDVDHAEFLDIDEAGNRRASGRIRVLSGLAVAIPLAPLILFLASTVVSLSVWSASLVFLGGWFLPAAFLSRARVPAEAFARSLYLIAVATALIPVGLRVGGSAVGTGDLSVGYASVTAIALVVAGLAALLGTYMYRQARGRVTGELRAFENARQE